VTATTELDPLTKRFAHALLTLDERALAEVSSPDVSWSIPGTGLISGTHVGVPAVIAVASVVRAHGVSIEVEQVLSGRDGVTAILHETGSRLNKSLDVRVALTLLVRSGRVDSIVGYISDVTAYDDYLSR
jgi:ketosteroid isomerase-like protein